MDFDFTTQQGVLRKAARQFLTGKCPASLVRSVEETGVGYGVELWEKMAELGWPSLIVPEEFGGGGGTFLDVCILVEEMGRALAPVPFIPVVLSQCAIMEAGTEEQKKKFLPDLASGKLKMTLALHDSDFSFDPSAFEMEASRKGDQYVLKGAKVLVPFGVVADAYLIAARTARDTGDDVSLFLVDRSARGITTSAARAIGGDELASVTLDGVAVTQDRILGPLGEGQPLLERLIQRGAVLKCAEMIGGAQWVMEKTVDYVKERVQFGQPVGSFQAVQHRCANMAMSCDGARFVTYQAAWLQSEGVPCEREVAIAKAWVSEAYTRICLDAHQAHGAIGFTKEYDLQLYTRRAKAAELAFGDARHHYEALANLMGL